MDDPHKDLRSLGDRLFDKRDLPVAEGTDASRPAASMIRARSFYFAIDTGILWYSDGSTWTAASTQFGKVSSGLNSALPAASAKAQQLYFATDVSILYYSNGTSWTAASNSFGPKVYVANVEGESHFTQTSFGNPNVSGPSGPTLSGLPDGTYALTWGGSGTGDGSSGGSAAFMAVQANGGSVSNFLEVQLQGVHASAQRSDVMTVANSGSNTFNCVYATQLGHDADFRYRSLIAIKYA